jgi:hypothetical protein
MSLWALAFMIISGLTVVLNFIELHPAVYHWVYPILGMIFSITVFFYINSVKKGMDSAGYKQELEKLRAELDRTKQRVADNMTKIEFPAGYKESEKLNLDTTKIEFPEGYKKKED